MSAIALPTGRNFMTVHDTPSDAVRRAADSIGLDLVSLEGLLDCAGPLLAPELRRRFLTDLTTVHAGLRLATTCAETERHAHVLLALAGQAGATALQSQVSLVLVAARARDAAKVAALLPPVLGGTEALVAVVTGMPGPWTDR
jgi:hypothetical protein